MGEIFVVRIHRYRLCGPLVRYWYMQNAFPSRGRVVCTKYIKHFGFARVGVVSKEHFDWSIIVTSNGRSFSPPKESLNAVVSQMFHWNRYRLVQRVLRVKYLLIIIVQLQASFIPFVQHEHSAVCCYHL